MPTVAFIIRGRRERKTRKATRQRRSRFWLFLIVALPGLLALAPLLIALALAIWLYAQASSFMPADPVALRSDISGGYARYVDRGGRQLIYAQSDPLGDGRRWTHLDDLPGYIVDATILAEDPDFYQSAHFDPLWSLSQIWRYMLGAPVSERNGIIARLTRETWLPRARASGLDQQLLEAALSAELRRRYSPRELLEWHLNSNYYGSGAFGIEAAAGVYLGKSAADLSLADAALLAAIAPSPHLNPHEDRSASLRRGSDLLFAMLNAGLIDQAGFEQQPSPIQPSQAPRSEVAPDFVDLARSQARLILDGLSLDGDRLLSRGNLKITTSLDLELYQQSECLIRAHLQPGTQADPVEDDAPCPAAAFLRQPPIADDSAKPDRISLVLLDVETGEILSLVGAAQSATHQPASLLQPFVYLEAFLRRSHTPASMVFDLPRSYSTAGDGVAFAPVNPDGRFRGPLNLRDALAGGLLPAAAQVADEIGMASIIATARRLGFDSLAAAEPTLELLQRGGDVSVLDSGYAYSVLAALGTMRGLAVEPIAPGFRGRQPVAVLQIADAAGEVIWSYPAADSQTVIIEPSLAYQINHILSDETARARILELDPGSLDIGGAVALLDGMSADRRDSWTLGYTPRLLLAVHGGRADGGALSPHPYERAASAPVWRALMEFAKARDSAPVSGWQAPADINEFLVCQISGQLPAATDHCPTRREIVAAGSPLQRDSHWQSIEINRATGDLASVMTPDHLREEVVYFVPGRDIIEWWRAEGKPLPPTEYDSASEPADLRPAQLTQPAGYAYIGGVVEVAGEINDGAVVSYQLLYGAGVNPSDFVELAADIVLAAPVYFRASWDTSSLQGVYSLRLIASYADGRRASDTRQVTLDNTPPTVDLRESDDRATIAWPAQSRISLLADARDNLTIDRVEFYQDGELLGADRDWPYGLQVEITAPGAYQFSARVVDQVGNSATSELLLTALDQR